MSSNIPISQTEQQIFEVHVDKKQFANALQIIAKYKDPEARTLRLSCENDHLVFEIGLGKHLVNCVGSFSGVVKIAQKLFQNVVPARLDNLAEDTVAVSCFDGSLRFKGHEFKCRFEKTVKQIKSPNSQITSRMVEMPLRWSAPLVGPDALATLQAAEARFPVSLIATLAENLQCCSPTEKATEAASRTQTGDFDHLPVKSKKGIIGLFSRKANYGAETVAEAMEHLNESILMAADASMLHFLEKADKRPFVFLVEKESISGVATLSDISKVAARPPMFLRFTVFEILLTNWIARNTTSDEDWLKLVPNARSQVERFFTSRQAKGEDVDRLTVASLGPKLDVARKLGAFKSEPKVESSLRDLCDFRDKISHAREIGADPISAASIPNFLRLLRHYIGLLEKTAE
ncbi:MAG: hypothetical protein SFV81_13160 [Pirellulaceae bacterium]|nr:hypothetical protein [Pirellulaceae bacterium]